MLAAKQLSQRRSDDYDDDDVDETTIGRGIYEAGSGSEQPASYKERDVPKNDETNDRDDLSRNPR